MSPLFPRLFPEPRTLRLAPGGLEALRASAPKGKVAVVLSNHFVRYALVPWNAQLAGDTEETAYVRHHFARIHGERAKAWSFRASPASAGQARLCSAIDATLLEEIKAAFKGRLVSLQPLLMSAFNRARAAVPSAGAWLVMAEPERACIALYAKGAWQSVHNGRGEWPELLERERHRIGGEVPDRVLLHAEPAMAMEAPGWKVERLAA